MSRQVLGAYGRRSCDEQVKYIEEKHIKIDLAFLLLSELENRLDVVSE
jgi:hypothetical protein